MRGKAIFSEEDTNEIVHHAPISMYDAEEEVIQINVPRNQAVVIMDGENVIGVLATHQIMKGWQRKHMADYILKKLKKGNQNGK
jgi:predicted transcriptional regulator